MLPSQKKKKNSGKKNLYLNVIFKKFNSQEVFCKTGVLKNFAKFTGEHLCWGLFFNNATGLSPATLLKRTLRHGCFPANLAEFLRIHFLQNIGATASKDSLVISNFKSIVI